MDDNRIKIVASLDIPKTVSTIEDDLEKVKRQLDANKALSIACNLDANSLATLQNQISEISKKLKIDAPKIEIQAGTGQSAQNIENVAKSVETVTNKVLTLKKTLADLDSRFVESFRAVENSGGIINAERTMATIQSRLSSLGTVTVTGKYNDQESADSINKIIARIQAASGEVRELNFLLDSTGQKFEYIGGSYSDKGVGKIQQDLARLSKELANFEASHKSIESGLIEPLTTARNAIIDLESGVGSVESAQKALDNLKTAAANIGTSLKSTGSSFNIFDNAINKAKNFDNTLNALRKDIDALSDESAKLSLGDNLTNASKSLIELQRIESESGRGLEWSKKYGEVSQAIQDITNGLKAAQKEEKALDRELSKSNKINKLTADMKAYAAANERAIKSTKQMSDGMTFTDKWSSLSQMAQNADLTDRELKKLVADMAVFKKEASAAGISGASAFDKFAKSFKLVSTYISANQLINMAISKIREAVEELKNVDNILTEISKTSERSAESLSKLGKGAFDVASKYGRTASDYLLGVQEMSRAGFGEVESENLAQLSLLAQSAGDMTAELANEYIIATNAAYGYQGSLEKLTKVLDSQNYVTNHYALNMSQLAEATKIAGSQAAQSGIGIDEMTAALATMISTTQQGGEIASRALRGILMNIQQVKGEVGDGEEDITAESLSKYEKAAEALGVSLKEVRNGAVALRDPMVVLNELAVAYNKEADDSIKKANLISAIGGKYRGNQLSALLANWDTYKDILETYRSEDAIGSATEEAAKSANNWMGTLNQLKNAWTELVNEVVNSDAIIEILNLVKEGLLDIKKSGILEYVGNLVTIATKLLKPIKTIHDTFSKYTYGGMFKGLSMFADWLNRDKIEAEKAKQAIEEEQKLRESAISNIQAYSDESQAIGNLVGQYVKLVSSTKDATEIKDGLTSIQDQIIEKYGLEAGAIDLVNDKLSKNIELLVEQEKERNNAWLRENNENIQAAEDFFNQEHNAYDLLSFHGEEDSLKKSFGAARIEASKYFEYLKEEFKKAGISDLIQENLGFSQDSFTYGFALKEGLAPEQQVSTIKKVIESYEKMYKEMSTRGFTEYFNLQGEDYNNLINTLKQYGDYLTIIQEKTNRTNSETMLESLLGNEEDLKKYESAIENLVKYNNILNDTNAEPVKRFAASQELEKQKDVIKSLIQEYPALKDQVESAMEEVGLSMSDVMADEQQLYDDFMKSLDETHKVALGNIDKLESAMASAIKGEGLSHDSAWELLKLDTDKLLKPVVDSAGKYHFELNDIVALKDSIIEQNKTLLEQEIETAKVKKQEEESTLRIRQMEMAEINAKIRNEASGNTRPTEETVRKQADLRRQIESLTKSVKAYGDAIERDSLLIKEYNAHSGNLLNTEKMLQAQIDALKKSQEQLKTEISDLNTQADKMLKAQEMKIDGIVDGLEAESQELEDSKQLLEDQLSVLEEQKEELDEIVKNYETIASVVDNTVSKQIDELEKNRQTIEDYYNDLINKLKEENSERADALDYAEKLAALENAKNNKVRVYGTGTGWTYKVDQDALVKAQRALEDADTNKAVSELEKERDKAISGFDEQIKAFEEYADEWKDTVEEIRTQEDERLAAEILGSDWREKIASKDIDVLKNYRSEYRNYNAQLKSITDNEIKNLKASIDAKNAEIETKKKQIQVWKDYKSSVQNAVKSIKDSLDGYDELLNNIMLDENSTYEQRQANLNNFANKYSDIISQINRKNSELDTTTNKISNLNRQITELNNNPITIESNLSDAADEMAEFIDKYRDAIEAMRKRLDDTVSGYGVVNSAWDAKLAEAANAMRRMGSYSEGGSVAYTGLAQVHGSPNKSETVFNASQSKELWDMVRTGNFTNLVADRAIKGVSSVLNNNTSNLNNSRVININGMVIKADNPQQFHNQFMTEINKYWNVQLTESPIR